jgi:hypothetical protein
METHKLQLQFLQEHQYRVLFVLLMQEESRSINAWRHLQLMIATVFCNYMAISRIYDVFYGKFLFLILEKTRLDDVAYNS